MRNFAFSTMHYLIALTLFTVIVPHAGHTKEKATSILQSGGKSLAIKKQARLVDSGGYRLLSPNSTLRCTETLRGTLDCKP
jgi:hypothetical protein